VNQSFRFFFYQFVFKFLNVLAHFLLLLYSLCSLDLFLNVFDRRDFEGFFGLILRSHDLWLIDVNFGFSESVYRNIDSNKFGHGRHLVGVDEKVIELGYNFHFDEVVNDIKHCAMRHNVLDRQYFDNNHWEDSQLAANERSDLISEIAWMQDQVF